MFEGIIRIWELISNFWWSNISPIFIIKQYEKGIILRWGIFKKELKQGINYKIPFIDESVQFVFVANTLNIPNINITTIDGKTVSISSIIEYNIEDARKYVLDSNEPISNCQDICKKIIANYLTDCSWEEIKKKTTQTQIKNKMKDKLKDLGMNITDFGFSDIAQTRPITLFGNYNAISNN